MDRVMQNTEIWCVLDQVVFYSGTAKYNKCSLRGKIVSLFSGWTLAGLPVLQNRVGLWVFWAMEKASVIGLLSGVLGETWRMPNAAVWKNECNAFPALKCFRGQQVNSHIDSCQSVKALALIHENIMSRFLNSWLVLRVWRYFPRGSLVIVCSRWKCRKVQELNQRHA